MKYRETLYPNHQRWIDRNHYTNNEIYGRVKDATLIKFTRQFKL